MPHLAQICARVARLRILTGLLLLPTFVAATRGYAADDIHAVTDLSRCFSPRAITVAAAPGSSTIQRFIEVGDPNLSGCALSTATPYTASAIVLNGSGWLVLSPASGTFSPGAINTLTATINPAALSQAGTYQAMIRIAVPSLNMTYTVPVTLALSSKSAQLSLSWTSFAFQAVEQAAAPPPQTMRIYDGAPGTVDWTISSADTGGFPSWLSVSPLSGTAGSAAGQGSPVSITVNQAGLTAGPNNTVYSALLKVTSPSASNSPEYVSISFHVVRSTAAPTPLLTAYGLVFNFTENGTIPPAQTFQFSNTGGGSIIANLSRTVDIGNWLVLSKGSATTAGGPDSLQISVDPTGIPVGLHRGKVTASFTTSTGVTRLPQDVDVLLIVNPGDPIRGQRSGDPAAACAPTRMDLIGATLGNGLNLPVSFPQVMLAQLVNDCGQSVTGATVVAVAEGLSLPLPEVGGGLYSAMFTPQKVSASSSIFVTAFHPSFATVQRTFTVATVAASGNTVLPALFNQGVVEGAGFSQGRPLVPGGIISLFGSNLAPNVANASVIPLERSLAQTSVRIGLVDAPLYFVSPDQINAQLPFESVPGDTVSVIIGSGGKFTAPQLYQISPAQPGIFQSAATAAVLDEFFQTVTAQNPARIGKVIQIFSNGLGFTNPLVATGTQSPSFSNVQLPVTVTLGGVQAHVDYQGLAPGYVGLYQVNVVVPPGVAPGAAVPLVILQNGIPSNPDLPVTIPVSQ